MPRSIQVGVPFGWLVVTSLIGCSFVSGWSDPTLAAGYDNSRRQTRRPPRRQRDRHARVVGSPCGEDRVRGRAGGRAGRTGDGPVARDCDAVLCVGSDYTDVSASTEFALNLRLADNLAAPVLAVVSGRRRSADEVVAAARVARDSVAAAGVPL